MEILDEVIKKLTEAADFTIKEAEKLTDTAKAKLELAEEESRLKALFASLGRRVYDDMTGSGEIPEAYAETAAEIKAKLAKIEDMKNRQQAAKENMIVCPGCKAKLEKGSAYCKYCGLKQ